jgi:recombination protein RecT
MTEGNLPVRKDEAINTIKQFFVANKKVLSECLPQTLTPDLFIGAALTRIRLSADLQKCSSASLMASIWVAAQSGLDLSPSMEEADLIPRWSEKLGAYEANFQPRYGGLIKLVKQTGGVSNIYAHIVYKQDDFDFALGDTPFLRHKPDLDGPQTKGDITNAYAVAKLSDGSVIFEVMTIRQIEAIRSRSPAGESGPWTTDYVQMCRKTAIRRLCKYLPKSRYLAAALEAEEAQEVGRKPQIVMPQDLGAVMEQADPKTGEIIEGEKVTPAAPPPAEKPPLPKPKRSAPKAAPPVQEAPPAPAPEERPPDEQPPPDIDMDFING